MSTGASLLMRLGVPVMKRSATMSANTRTGWPAIDRTSSSSRSAVGSGFGSGICAVILARAKLHSVDLGERLRRRIEAEGAISFAAFMEEALYGEGGYYSREELPIGAAGDFITGSSWSSLFGRTTARLVRRLDEALGFCADVLEVGPGNGA